MEPNARCDICNPYDFIRGPLHSWPETFHHGPGEIFWKERMMENLFMGLIGLTLLGYLFYTLFRPDRF